MLEIRNNNEEENILIEGTFEISFGAVLIMLFTLIVFGSILAAIIIFAPEMVGEINGEPATGWIIAFPFVLVIGGILLGIIIVSIFRLIAIKKSQLVVTNKRIYGVYSLLFARKDFSYRLDEVDNMEMISSFGQHTLAIQFTQGHGPSNMATVYVNGVPTSNGYNILRMSNLKNYQEVMEVVNSLITSKKNLVDVQTEIEQGKLNAENRKADALENVAKKIVISPSENSSTKSNDYIDELRRLKELLDEGIITKEEFEQEKKEILDNNH